MNNKNIRKYEVKDFEDCLEILVTTFRSKFKVNLSIQEIIILVKKYKLVTPEYFCKFQVYIKHKKIVAFVAFSYDNLEESTIPRFKIFPIWNLLNRFKVWYVFFTLEKGAYFPKTGQATLHIINVHPIYQRQGIGTELIEFNLKRIKKYKPKISEVFLYVYANNPVIELYKKFGFKVYREEFSLADKLFMGNGRWYLMKVDLTSFISG